MPLLFATTGGDLAITGDLATTGGDLSNLHK